MTLVYEVELSVVATAESELVEWIPRHIDQAMSTSSFVRAEWFKEWRPDDKKLEVDFGELTRGPVKFKIRFFPKSEEHLFRYIEDHADRIRNEARELFPGKFTTRRNVFELEESYVDSHRASA